MSTTVRVRFAPSPTGTPHLGNIRSALFNYLFAKGHKGSFILRLEDTDRERLVTESVALIQESLQWLGINPDEGTDMQGDYGPYLQSERLSLYQQHAKDLLEQGSLYQDYTSPEQLAELRQQAKAAKRPFRFSYDQATVQPTKVGDKPVLRFRVQPGSDITWEDAVWGPQRWQRGVIDDFVAIKSDGFPTYHFANIVDDHLMKISHVIRAAEWIPSTPKHLLLYEAFGWQPPVFAHLPQVLGPDKAKLSKRHGAKSVLEYRDEGYLPEALFTYLASLGFNDGTTRETYTPGELIAAFDFKRVQSSPAIFDAARLDWLNGIYIRQLTTEELLDRIQQFWPADASGATDDYKREVLALVHERLKFFAELPELTRFFFSDPQVDPHLFPKQLEAASIPALLEAIHKTLGDSDFSYDDLEQRLRGFAESSELKAGPVFGLIRIAITGQTAAPGLFETLHTLGKPASLRRLKTASAQF